MLRARRQAILGTLSLALLSGCGVDDASRFSRAFSRDAGVEGTFVVASYNVENFFDQVDDDRNESYGDYRIKANSKGQYSNWGQLQSVGSEKLSFTEIKARGVRRIFEAIKEGGPEVVGLCEVESAEALDALRDEVKELGYQATVFSGDLEDTMTGAIGQALITKFPVMSKSLVVPAREDGEQALDFDLRPILKVTVNAHGKPLTVYVNHWKSQSGPESLRVKSARALAADIDRETSRNARFDWVALGDFNSRSNENEIMTNDNDDTQGLTGINDVLKAGSDLQALYGTAPARYNLSFEYPKSLRNTEWSPKFGWTDFDHLIIGNSAVDRVGVNLVTDSYVIPSPEMESLRFVYTAEGYARRWAMRRENNKSTKHFVGGFSDHMPVFATFMTR